MTDGIAGESTKTIGRIIVASRLAEKRKIAISPVKEPRRIDIKGIKAIGKIVVASGVAEKCADSVRRILVTGCIAQEGKITVGRVEEAGGVAKECVNTVGRVADARREIEECVGTLGGVLVGIASIRFWDNRSRCGRKRKQGESERKRDEQKTAYNPDWLDTR